MKISHGRGLQEIRLSREIITPMITFATAGFSFKDWKGVVYPEHLPPGSYLEYYHRYYGFDAVEIDSSYYSYLSAKVLQSWMGKTPDCFKFTLKLHQDLTLNASREYPLKSPNREAAAKFRRMLEPLAAGNRIISLLAQFGPLFTHNPQHEAYLSALRSEFPDLPLLIEFRHPSWLIPEQRAQTFAWLKSRNLGYVCADLPDLIRLPPLVPAVVGDIACLRLHGRNPQWFGASSAQRYNYRYSDEELKLFLPVVKALDKEARYVLVTFNNCHGGNALVNALRLREFLEPGRKEPSGQLWLT